MIYRSNLECPDLTPNFAHIQSRVMGHSFGHEVLSDWSDKADDDPVFGVWKKCGFWTHDEAAILYHVVKRTGGTWLDIGCNVGWTTAHIALEASDVVAVDYMLALPEFAVRFAENTRDAHLLYAIMSLAMKSTLFFEMFPARCVSGACIDGDHDSPAPLLDAFGAVSTGARVIIFHDFIGQPVRDAVKWLMGYGFKCRVYFTPHMVACCWRGDGQAPGTMQASYHFIPPDHVPDPNLPDLAARCPDFDFSRCE